MDRTSVFDRRTFPTLCQIYGRHVTTLCVNSPPWVSKLSQLSLPSPGSENEVSTSVIRVSTLITEVKTFNNGMAAQVIVRVRGLGPLRPRLNADPVCE